MAAMSDSEILNVVQQELAQAAGHGENHFIENNRRQARDTYLGNPNGREVEGRSHAISTDVADSVEWILPEIIEVLTSNGEIVTFDPAFDGDEEQARLETAYVYDTLMKKNADGFTVIHEMVKDALIEKNGIYRVYYDEEKQADTETHEGLTEIEVMVLLAPDDVEIMEKSERVDEVAHEAMYAVWAQQVEMAISQQQQPPPEPVPPLLYDVKIKRTKTKKSVKVDCVPPEEFRIDRMHNSINPRKARFCALVSLKTASDLIAEGISKDVVDNIPRGARDDMDREHRFYSQGETVYPTREVSNDESQDMIEVSECFMHIDTDGDGVAEFRKIRVAGGDVPGAILDNVEMDIDDHPFGACTAILMSHKFYGLSIYDRLSQIQEIKTTITRSILDNLYLRNNQRTKVTPGVNLDDLLVSRPGGIIRMDRLDNAEALITPEIGQDAYQMLDYQDQVRSGRVGVSPDAQMQTDSIGSNVGSMGVDRLMTAKEKLVGLMVRVIAETAIKPMMYQIRDALRKNMTELVDYNHRGQWTKVNPSQWSRRDTSTVRVGTGSGNTEEQRGVLMNALTLQEKLMSDPSQTIVTHKEVYNAIASYMALGGVQNIENYFRDPETPEAQQEGQAKSQQQQEEKQQQNQLQVAVAQAQTQIAQAEQMKAEAAAGKVQIQAQLDAHKLQSENEISQLKLKLQNAENMRDAVTNDEKTSIDWAKLDLEREKLARAEALKLTEMEVNSAADLSRQNEENRSNG